MSNFRSNFSYLVLLSKEPVLGYIGDKEFKIIPPKLLDYYKKDTEQELRDEMFELNKNGKMASRMQQKIVEDIEVTPEEVRQFFNN